MISATILKDSIAPNGKRLISFEVELHRFILAELNTHRILSKNTASSRAIPFKKMVDIITDDTAFPVHWGKNQAGMVAEVEVDRRTSGKAMDIWIQARDSAIGFASQLNELGIHKQATNRLIETFGFVKTVLSGTEFANLIWLRNHQDAQPEFRYLMEEIVTAIDQSVPSELKPGEWHLPYVSDFRDDRGVLHYLIDGTELDLETAKKVSASCCAQVSYRKLNDSIEQAEKVFGMLNIGSDEKPSHSSPLEHQATPINRFVGQWEDGVSHMTRDGMLWSGPFAGWIQQRKLFPNEAKW